MLSKTPCLVTKMSTRYRACSPFYSEPQAIQIGLNDVQSERASLHISRVGPTLLSALPVKFQRTLHVQFGFH